jgi:hypothetical protein
MIYSYVDSSYSTVKDGVKTLIFCCGIGVLEGHFSLVFLLEVNMMPISPLHAFNLSIDCNN